METLKDILEIIYYLSGPALVIIAVYGLKQIKVTVQQIQESRETRKIKSKRESYTIAAEQCKYYMETIIPLINALDKVIDANNIEYFEKSEILIENDKIGVKPYMKDGALDKVFEHCLEEVHTVINYIEGFSVYFISGVASENVGFNTVGKTYVNSVKTLLPMIIPFGKDDSFNHTKSLFMIWNSRLENKTLEKEKAELEEKLKRQNVISVDAIGTK